MSAIGSPSHRFRGRSHILTLGPAVLGLVGFFVPQVAYAVDGPQFESPPVHPIELSADGESLYALHQADHRLLVFDLTEGETPERVAEIFVGLEPISVRERIPGELWVVNHLSDCISIVDVSTGTIVNTLQTGDEPTDVVFAGSPERAFVCVSQENLIRVYDPANLDEAPVEIPLSMSDPLALEVSPDGSAVYVIALESGNQTTIVPFDDVVAGGGPPPPDPPMSEELPAPPSTGLIVRHDGTAWRDEAGTSWNDFVGYRVLDYDVIAIDSRDYTSPQVFQGVGTSLFGIAVHPIDGRIYVSNQEAFNEVRFEVNVSGRFAHNRVSVLTPGSSIVEPQHLNGHIDYSNPEGTPEERDLSLSIPTALTVASDGSAVYVAAFGSAKVGVLDGNGVIQRRIDVGHGPCGLALDEARNRLYVVRRIPGALDVVDLTDDSVSSFSLGFDPTPLEIQEGRKRFYDGGDSSAHGDISCATCHVFGGTDHIAWNLGDPQGLYEYGPSGAEFHPMKGPLMTQSLRGMTDTDPFHWRGDRATLEAFNPAFVSLLGRDSGLNNFAFDEMSSFLFSLAYPPNPNRHLDGSLPDPPGQPSPLEGERLFNEGGLFGGIECTGCHFSPAGENGIIMLAEIFDGQQDLDVPQLRNLYEKRGFDPTADTNVRGYGFTHDGAFGSLVEFLEAPRFTFDAPSDRNHVEAFMFTFDTGAHACIGSQWTARIPSDPEVVPAIETLSFVADGGSAGLIAKGTDSNGDTRGWLYGGGLWQPDRASEPLSTTSELFDLAGPGAALTFTAVYPGTELRLGIDRDLDGSYDRDEMDNGTDPGDPDSYGDPAAIETDPNTASSLLLEPVWPNPAHRAVRIAYQLVAEASIRVEIHEVGGRRVRTIASKTEQSGRNELVWDLRDDGGRTVPAGLYFVRISNGETSRTRRIVIRR